MNPINIAIADDHLLVINGLKAMLENTNDIRILFSATSGHELLSALKENQPEVLLLDIQMPDVNGIDLCMKSSAGPKRQRSEPIISRTV